jgi:hypothetical protein
MPTDGVPILRVSDGTDWSSPRLVGASNTVQRLMYSPDGVTWQPQTVADTAPPVPANFRCTNIGAAVASVEMAWDAASGADSYTVYGGTSTVSTGSLTATVPLTAGGSVYNLYVRASKAGAESAASNYVAIRSGTNEVSVAAGTGYVSAGVNSVNRWRGGAWNYGGSNQPYIGWYSTEAYRYAAFIELPAWHLRNVITQAYPQLTGLTGNVTCTGAGIFFARDGVVGNFSTAYTMQCSLGNGISYSNGAEPGAQVNTYDFTIQPASAGRVGYSMPPNWYQAIYQDHAQYNGLLWRPYTHTGARQPYMAFSTANITFDMSLSWPKIVTTAQTMTSYA